MMSDPPGEGGGREERSKGGKEGERGWWALRIMFDPPGGGGRSSRRGEGGKGKRRERRGGREGGSTQSDVPTNSP